MKFLSLAVAAVLCAGIVSCDDGPDKPKNTGGASGSGDGNGYTPDNPQTDEYGIAVSQEVDLGLSVNWAGWNVGTTFPEGYGGYYAWGETEEKNSYDWTTYKWCRGSSDTMTKYCTDSECGTVDNRTDLEPEDDVARKKWGNGWRMPTYEEQLELENTNNCTWEWITYKGVNGYKVTGKRLSNGNRNSIFLPAASLRRDYPSSAGDAGRYWSSTLYSSYSFNAKAIHFSISFHSVGTYDRYLGQSVRAVKDK